jgi:hypothetical protein
MKNTNYFSVLGWMVNDLKLKSNHLLVYALIYGFCQNGNSEFNGSLSYIQKTLGISRNTAIKILKDLEDENHITKHQQGVKNMSCNSYKIGSSIFALGSAEIDKQVVQKLTKGSAETAPNNNIDNNISESNNALGFLKEKSPQRFEAFLMQNKSKIDNWVKFTKDFNNKVIIEGLDFDINKLFARLETYAGNWILNNQKNKENNQGESAAKIKWS